MKPIQWQSSREGALLANEDYCFLFNPENEEILEQAYKRSDVRLLKYIMAEIAIGSRHFHKPLRPHPIKHSKIWSGRKLSN